MSSLRSAFEELRSESLGDLPAEQLAADLVELEQIDGWLQVEKARRVAVFEIKRGQDLEGHTSVTAFLKHRCGMFGGRAHQLVAVAHAIPRLPATFQALEGGRVSFDQVRVIVNTGERVTEDLIRDEGVLVAALEGLSVADTRRLVEYWKTSVDGPGTATEAEEKWGQRYLSASRTIAGMVRLDGLFDPENGDLILTALQAATPPPDPDEARTPGQRRADAPADLCQSYLDSRDAPGSEKPHVLVLTDLNAFKGSGGGTHETASGEVLTPEDIRRICCDCTISRIVFGPDSEPIDIGRATRVVPAPMRRVVIARDRHCTHPGCDRPARWCDNHHIWHWIDGGPTALWNLKLLRLSHESG